MKGALPSLFLLTSAFSSSLASPGKRPSDQQAYATIHNFAPNDVLNGDDGFTTHPLNPLTYGKPVVHLSDVGDMIEEHNAELVYLDGKYYLYAEAWACGKIVFFSGGNGTKPRTRTATTVGILTIEDASSATKPHVHFSESLNQYVLIFSAGASFNLKATGGIWYTTSDTPTGPWSEPGVISGDFLAHDFDTAEDDEGNVWIATDSFSGEYDPEVEGLPLWNLHIQKLNPELNAVVNGSTTQILEAIDFEAIGLAVYNGNFYITGGITCGNCQASISYMMAPSPSGPWTEEELIAADGCTGQNKGMATLPSPEGPVILSSIWGYRTSPDNIVVDGMLSHGDNSQAIASTYWFRQQFADDGTMKALACDAQISVPLAEGIAQPASPLKYQPDCRIRNNSTISQSFVIPRNFGSSLVLPIFQRTDNGGAYNQSGPVMDAPVDVEIRYLSGRTTKKSFEPSDVSWAPENLEVELQTVLGVNLVSQITLSTSASNGCFGTVVRPKSSLLSIFDAYKMTSEDGIVWPAGAQLFTQDFR
ncbi:glycosyl hydrolase [Xylariomycetidae sp. FL2044]|nr:glycosyl hydrolase [Xylariomycetidae sp. FL2044]